VTTVFKKPPLVELIAELRWGAPTLGIVPGSLGPVAIPTPAGPDGKPQAIQFSMAGAYDAFFMHFGAQAHKMGFTVQERIVPPNAFLMPYQTVWRWRKPDVNGLFLQLGAGVFTINGGPPDYTHWGEFLPTVKEGVAGLLDALNTYPGGRPSNFNQTLLRYIDLFADDTAKLPPLDFLRDVMGLKIQLPDVISELPREGRDVIPHLTFAVPVKDGAVQLLFSHGTVAGRTGHIFDSTVVRNAEVALSSDAVAESFTESHATTNKIFMALTKPLHAAMEAVE